MKLSHLSIVGATGLVGRHLVSGWQTHRRDWPSLLVGSPNSVGHSYKSVWNTKESKLVSHYGNWWQPICFPSNLPDYQVASVDDIPAGAIVLSTVPERAGQDEDNLVARGCTVISNSPYRRTDLSIPLWVPGIGQSPSGNYIKIPNCATIGITLALAPVVDWLDQAIITISTYQSISGRGDAMYPHPLADANVFPLRHTIEDSENRIAAELRRLLPNVNCSISCYRIPTQVGHLIDIAVHGARETDLTRWIDRFQTNGLKVMPIGHPQSRIDATIDNGMIPAVGNMAFHATTNTIRFTVVINNLIRGAAGSLMMALDHVDHQP